MWTGKHKTEAARRLLSALRSHAFVASVASYVLFLVAACDPAGHASARAPSRQASSGEYLFSANKLFESDAPFDIRWKVVYPKAEDFFDPSINLTDRELTLERCDRCHECGFALAFDKAHYGTQEWSPRIRGDDWATPVNRMQRIENAFLNEMIAMRIYSFLRDETTGEYDEGADTKGAVVVELDPPAAPAANGH